MTSRWFDPRLNPLGSCANRGLTRRSHQPETQTDIPPPHIRLCMARMASAALLACKRLEAPLVLGHVWPAHCCSWLEACWAFLELGCGAPGKPACRRPLIWTATTRSQASRVTCWPVTKPG